MNHLETSEKSLKRDDELQREIKRPSNEDLFEQTLRAENRSRVLKLKINEEKSQVVPVDQSKFLGFTFNRGKIAWHTKTVETFKRKVSTRP